MLRSAGIVVGALLLAGAIAPQPVAACERCGIKGACKGDSCWFGEACISVAFGRIAKADCWVDPFTGGCYEGQEFCVWTGNNLPRIEKPLPLICPVPDAAVS
jgi:hypothetical protein